MRLLSNTAWLVGCRVTANLLNLVLFVAVSRTFGPEGIGEYSYGFAMAGFAYVLSNLGIDEYGVREYVRTEEPQRAALLGRLLGTQSVMVFATYAVLAGYLWLTGAPASTAGITLALGTYQIGYSIARTLFVPALAAQQMVAPALIELVCRGGAFVAAAALVAWARWSLVAAMAAFAGFGIAMALLSLALARRHVQRLQFHSNVTTILTTWRTLWSFAVAELLAQLYGRVGLVIIALIIGDQAAGLYATGMKLVETAAIPFVFLGIAAYPRLSKLSVNDLDGFRQMALRLWSVWISAGVLVIWGLYFVVPDLLAPLLGAKFDGAGPVVRMMTLLALMQIIEVFLTRLLLAADLQVQRVPIIAAGAAISVALNVLLIPRFGFAGAVTAGTIALATMNLLYGRALTARLPKDVALRGLYALFLAVAPVIAVTIMTEYLGVGPIAGAGSVLVTLAAVVVCLGRHWSRHWHTPRQSPSEMPP